MLYHSLSIMRITMDKHELLVALAMLGGKLPFDVEIVIGGGSALLLQDLQHRGTDDCDTIHAQPRLASIRRYIEEVAEEMDLSPVWLNDAAKSFAEILPPSAPDYFEDVAQYGRLRVRHVGRLNLIFMKFASLRPVDMQDLEVMEPTEEEIDYVREELDRVARLDPAQAMKVDLYLRQGGRSRK